MKKHIAFTKYQGCGNDFILIDEKEIEGYDDKALHNLIINICNRHYGIGGDGLIIKKNNPLTFLYYNNDGSKADVCGNGLRCFCLHLLKENVIKLDPVSVQTSANAKIVKVIKNQPFTCEVEMGKLSDMILKTHMFKGYKGYILDYNNQHVVFNDQSLKLDVEKLYHMINKDKELFNVSIFKLHDINHKQELEVYTYERGAHQTLACTSGACAAFVVASSLYGIKKATVIMQGGYVEIYEDEFGMLIVRGSACRICEGIYYA